MCAAALAAAAILLARMPALAGCADGPWPLEREAAALAQPASLPMVKTGTHLPVPAFLAFAVELHPQAEAGLPALPGRSADGAGMAGFVHLTIDTPGLYQMTVPDAAWLDVIVDRAALTPEAFTPAHDCPGVRKSIRFRLPVGDVILQISRTPQAELPLVLARIP